ncbi:GDSL family lipase [Sphingomonas sp. Leaf339]|nr:GDSL family lipase [Sphingomonas sp. Leaf339]
MMMKMLAATLMISLPFAALFAQTPKPTAAEQEAEVRLHQDWPWLERYRAANAALPTPDAKVPRIVFMGDSITQGWIDKVPAFFTPGRLDRGIGGQTTPQMVLRFRQDVIDLKPAVVQIMAGTNDIAGNTGPMTIEQTHANIMTMAELARAHGIRVILASIPPADHFPWRPGLATAPRIAQTNAWLKDYAARTGATYADYWTALHDGQALKAAYTYDGVHPNDAGYQVMAPVAEAAIKAALAKPAPKPIAR